MIAGSRDIDLPTFNTKIYKDNFGVSFGTKLTLISQFNIRFETIEEIFNQETAKSLVLKYKETL